MGETGGFLHGIFSRVHILWEQLTEPLIHPAGLLLIKKNRVVLFNFFFYGLDFV